MPSKGSAPLRQNLVLLGVGLHCLSEVKSYVHGMRGTSLSIRRAWLVVRLVVCSLSLKNQAMGINAVHLGSFRAGRP